MPKNNCLFRARCLEHKWSKYWIRQKNDTFAIYSFCSKDASVANIELVRLSPRQWSKVGPRAAI